MTNSLWHRFPKNDYSKIKIALKEMTTWSDDLVSKAEKEKILKSIDLMDQDFKTKKDENVKLVFLISCVEFFLIISEKNEAETLKKTLEYLYNYQSKKRGVA